MKCFNHHDRDAFGVCKTCGKGLCLDCMRSVDGMIVCKDNQRCSQTAHLVHVSYENIQNAYTKRSRTISIISGWIFAIAGLFMIYYGFGSDSAMMTLIGAIFAILGVSVLNNASKLKTLDSSKKE